MIKFTAQITKEELIEYRNRWKEYIRMKARSDVDSYITMETSPKNIQLNISEFDDWLLATLRSECGSYDIEEVTVVYSKNGPREN